MSASLVACGGGGGSSSPTPAAASNATTDAPATNSTPTTADTTLPVGTKLNDAGCSYQYTVTNNPVLSGADPLLSNQWYLQNTGQSGGTSGEDINAAAAWTNFPSRGAGVRVAVIDDSVEITHDDLAPNVVSGLSHNYRTAAPYPTYPMPCKSTDIHGTSVAGVLLGRDGNGVGVAGVASRASLVAYNALATSLQADIGDALTRDAQATSIYNSSWGSADNGYLHPVDNVFKNAVLYGATKGRGGKGSIYLFPAGNGGCYYTYPGYGLLPTTQDPNACNGYSDNSNFDGYSASPYVIAVCAVDDTGIRPWYGERGANILICGSSSDRGHSSNNIDDKRGYVTSTAVNNGYRSDFSGTSASTPQVAGVVALMLAERPDLTARDVRLILARTARQNNPNDNDWTTFGGYHFNHKFGFGVVDASAAVTLARSWTSVGGADSLVTCSTLTSSPGTNIPDAVAPTYASDGVTVTNDGLSPITNGLAVSSTACPISKIEYLQVNFVSDHTYGSDLKIELISPNGLISELATARACFLNDATSSPGDYVTCRTGASPTTAVYPDDADYADSAGGWTFNSVRHLDEPPTGNWQLRVTDTQRGDVGKLVRWSLAIAGR